MNRVGCLPVLLLYLAMGFGVISVGLHGLLSIPMDGEGNYSPFLEQQKGTLHDLHLAASDGSVLSRLQSEVPFSINGRWSHDGQRLLYVTLSNSADFSKNESALFVTDDAPNPGRKVLETDEVILSPNFSPDGQQIAYIQWRGVNESSAPPPALYVVDLRKDPAEPHLLLQPTGLYTSQIQWSPDGKEVLALQPIESSHVQTESSKAVPQVEVIRVNVETGASTPVLTLPDLSSCHDDKNMQGESQQKESCMLGLLQSLIWSGDSIYFNSFEISLGQDLNTTLQITPLHLYRWSLQEQRKTQLTEGTGWYLLPVLSPSGEQLAYLNTWIDEKMSAAADSQPGVFRSEVYVMNLTTRGQKKITGPSNLFQPFWVDEAHLGYVELAENSSIIWIQDLEKRTRRNLTSDLKTRFWEEKLKAAQAQQQPRMPPESKPSPTQMESAQEIEKLRAELSQKEERLQKLEDELNDKQRESQSLKQRSEYQENQISSLRQQVESSQRERRGSNGWIIITISAVLILFIVRLLF